VPVRPFWTTRLVRARDVQDLDVVRIDGRWREVMDAFKHGDAPEAHFGENSRLTKDVRAVIDRADSMWTAVRFVAEEECTGSEIVTRVKALLWCTLLEVQVQQNPLATRPTGAAA
jgi:hypothetical protein